MGVVEWLRKIKITKRELIIGIVLGVIIGVVVPPLGLMMLMLVILGLVVVGIVIMIFGSGNVAHLIMTFLAVRAADRISKRFAPQRGCSCAEVEAIDPLSLSPEEFEDLCVDLLSWMGYRNVRRVGGSGDMGLDILCLDEYGGRVGVQCKRYSPGRRVTAREVREFIGALSLYGCDSGILFTTSDLTDEGWEEVRIHGNITVIDGLELRSMLRKLHWMR